MLDTIGYIKASNTNMGDYFGARVILSADGSTLAVGAYREDSAAKEINGDHTDNTATDAGAVYVFTRSGNIWQQQAYIKALNSESGDNFGWSVALSADGSTLAVGAVAEDSATDVINGDHTDNMATDAGAVYIFTRSGNTWQQQAYIKATNAGEGDYFGVSIDLSADGNTLVVGAGIEDSAAEGVDGDQDDNSAADAGAVYVFTRSNSIWEQQAYIKASNTGADDRFGWSVALSGDGDTLVAGARAEDSSSEGIDGDQADNSTTDAGAVYVFIRSNSIWEQQAYIKASNTYTYDWFGGSVSLNGTGDTLAVAADVGFELVPVDNGLTQSGAVYMFIRNNDTWQQQAYLKASNSEANDRFGSALALSNDGDILAVGAHEDSAAVGIGGEPMDNSATGAGAAYVFIRSDDTWRQRAYVKASNTEALDFFGLSLTLNGDGNTLAVGAHGEGSAAVGVGGDQLNNTAFLAGAVYLY
ncbi:MAG: hypothetical protein AMJ55_04180 [Gammaproteobacteria bacterium SG8_15]|nr:MAG: hypothetical protein AMJ55_04180 [Gammaproteobacteria bacterium SG8_15]